MRSHKHLDLIHLIDLERSALIFNVGLADEVVASLSLVLATKVWTCEVGECGASLCSVECDARNCATLNWL